MVIFKSIDPEEYKSDHEFKIIYAFYMSPFGKSLIAVRDTDKSVVYLGFVDKSEVYAFNVLQKEWPLSEIIQDENHIIEEIAKNIFSDSDLLTNNNIFVLLKGTEFQVKTWQSLMFIPRGTLTTYEKVAQSINKPKAVRAVGNAVAKNKIAYLIPCHRVMGKNGSMKYAWGAQLKQEILTYESKLC